VSGPEFASAGLAELTELKALRLFEKNGVARAKGRAKAAR
jgi:hypothetical protein